MNRFSRRALVLTAILGLARTGAAQSTVTYEDRDGIRYQVTRQVVERQVPVTHTQPQQQTYYRQQVTTDNISHQQMYAVPVTQYQLVSTLHGRWNPFVTPYWTHEYQPVTTWTQQVANVQIPVSKVAMVPETRTVQVPVTTYQKAEQTLVSSIPVGPSSSFASAQPLTAATTPSYSSSATPLSSQSATSSQPTATLAARPPAPLSNAAPSATTYGGYTAGGVAMPSDPPRQATGWRDPSGERYGQRR